MFDIRTFMGAPAFVKSLPPFVVKIFHIMEAVLPLTFDIAVTRIQGPF